MVRTYQYTLYICIYVIYWCSIPASMNLYFSLFKKQRKNEEFSELLSFVAFIINKLYYLTHIFQWVVLWWFKIAAININTKWRQFTVLAISNHSKQSFQKNILKQFDVTFTHPSTNHLINGEKKSPCGCKHLINLSLFIAIAK